ncbi:unnamed protein product [Sphenostylis stenocarpa]|uniref:Uncharacterized protein n=1 Tax=Sphenostylis stenocarpa TaxID=92480 RepID=A0AA86SU25_9FABA|nr:unnamed protein product [Sphenostylis stenocarpa]
MSPPTQIHDNLDLHRTIPSPHHNPLLLHSSLTFTGTTPPPLPPKLPTVWPTTTGLSCTPPIDRHYPHLRTPSRRYRPSPRTRSPHRGSSRPLSVSHHDLRLQLAIASHSANHRVPLNCHLRVT